MVSGILLSLARQQIPHPFRIKFCTHTSIFFKKHLLFSSIFGFLVFSLTAKILKTFEPSNFSEDFFKWKERLPCENGLFIGHRYLSGSVFYFYFRLIRLDGKNILQRPVTFPRRAANSQIPSLSPKAAFRNFSLSNVLNFFRIFQLFFNLFIIRKARRIRCMSRWLRQ